MSKFLLILVGVVVIIGGIYLFSKNGMNGIGTENRDQQALGQRGTLADLLSMRGNLECMVSISGEGFSSQGDVFVFEDNLRGDFSSTVDGQSLDASMIQSEGSIYSWTSLLPQGYKFSVVDQETGEPGNFDTSTPLSYECSPWVAVDMTKFTPPTNIEFLNGDELEI